MKKLRTLLVIFDNHIPATKITAFRGAIIEKAGRDNILFHNHLGKKSYVYRYPLIQYKSIKQKPAIFCVDAGVDEIHRLFEQKSWDIQVNDEAVKLVVDRLDLKSTTLNVWEKMFNYQINRWQALNDKNYKTFQSITSLKERIAFLERVLAGNILSFAKGIDWHIEKTIRIEIDELKQENVTRMKDTKVSAYNVNFRCNVFLPDYIGLGKGASTGFGVIKQLRKNNNEEQ
ncbi:CRISPR-associated endonuclease Cas6 [Parafilimonas sp.]|uniref:CRISPR-associated endonuclease Cas6 n=1 Tax=Parafilimonas sp. TaxID=1969739 RepID=UPI0039E66398